MSAILIDLLIVILLVLANGLFAMAEMAVVSARKARLQQRANRGDARARAALELANAPNRFLSTTQIGITLVGILAGAFSGATLAEELAAQLSRVAWLASYREALSLGVVVLGITYLSLVLGELAPKQLALNNPERIAAAVAVPMRRLSALASPVIGLLSASTGMVLRVLRAGPSAEPPINEDEIRILIEQGTQAGMFEAAEQELVTRVFRFGDRRVGALMTPRRDIVWLDIDEPSEVICHTIMNSTHAVFPVGQGSLDNLLGVAGIKELLKRSLVGQPLDLKAVLQPPLLAPEAIPALQVLELFKHSGQGLALVIDEYGGIQGLVTRADILEALAGDMPTAGESVEAQAVRREDGSWLLDGTLLIDEFKELFRIERLPGERRAGYQTVGGFVMSQTGHIPATGESFFWRNLRFEVMDMDGHRVDKVLVTPQPPGSAEPPQAEIPEETNFNA